MTTSTTGVLRSSARPYLFAVILALVVGGYVEYLAKYVWTSIPLLFGQAPDIYVTAFGVGVAAVLWLLYRGHRTRDRLLVAFFVLLAVTWLVHWALSRVHGDAVTYAVLLYVPVVIALWWKTPTRSDVIAGLILLGWSLVAILVITRALELLGVWQPIYVGEKILSFELRSYWLPFSGNLGPIGRWHGPLGHAAKTGAAAAFLVILAVGLPRMRDYGARWVFGVIGVVVLVLTASRGSAIAAVAGVMVTVLFGQNVLTRRVPRKWLMIALGGLAALALIAVLIKNPKLTGRTTYWSLALDLWETSPVIGVGNSGMQASDLAIAGTNAHNIVFDPMVKFGLVGTVLVLAILTVAIVLAVRAVSLREVLPLALVVTYLVLGLSEADTEWLRMNLPWLWLVLAAVLAGRVREERPAPEAALSSTAT